jgi:hypothetical protein
VLAVFADILGGSKDGDDESLLPMLIVLKWMKYRLCFGENIVDFKCGSDFEMQLIEALRVVSCNALAHAVTTDTYFHIFEIEDM